MPFACGANCIANLGSIINHGAKRYHARRRIASIASKSSKGVYTRREKKKQSPSGGEARFSSQPR